MQILCLAPVTTDAREDKIAATDAGEDKIAVDLNFLPEKSIFQKICIVTKHTLKLKLCFTQ